MKKQTVRTLVDAAQVLLTKYEHIADSEDGGWWDVEKDIKVMRLRAAIRAAEKEVGHKIVEVSMITRVRWETVKDKRTKGVDKCAACPALEGGICEDGKGSKFCPPDVEA